MFGELWLTNCSGRCAWVQLQVFLVWAMVFQARRQPEDSTLSQFTYSSSQCLSFQKHGMTCFSVMSPFSTSSSPSSLGIQPWLGFVSGVHNNPSGFGPSVNLHKVDLVTRAHLGHLYYSVTICESNLLQYMKWYVVHTILTS